MFQMSIIPIQKFRLTLTDSKEISKRPKGKPDYVSYYFNKIGKRKISSEYWYNENGVVRGSDHWGEGISSWAVINVEKEKNSFYLHEVAILNKKEDETLFKTGNSQKTTPSNASSSIYSLLNKLQNVNNTDTKFSLDVNFSYNELIKKPYIKKAMLIGIVKNSVNEPFVVSFIVNKHTNEIQSIDVLYAVNAKKEPAGSIKSPEVSTPPTGSTISISNLFDCVNNLLMLFLL